MVMMADLGVRAIGEKPGVIEKEQAADVSRLSIAERQAELGFPRRRSAREL